MNENEKKGIRLREKVRTTTLNNLNMEVFYSAHVFLDERWKNDGVCSNFSRLYYIKEGKGYLKCNGKLTELTGGNAYLIPAGCTVSYGCTSLEKIFFHFSISTTDKNDLLDKLDSICEIPFEKDDFDIILKCSSSENYIDFLKTKSILYKTISDCAKKYDFEESFVKQYSEIVEKTINYIKQHISINLSVEEISKDLFVSDSKLRKTFKKDTGKTIGKYIDDLVFFKAKQLLAKKHIPIGEISGQLGFCDQFYFARRFKERYNQTPSEFRKEIITL